ncbi:hypothetical protein L3X38_034181 [Prunus dulcis]|uniref:Reverse transcriptase Ty1/copia-type domain-containing protein n=1 Tax=Prunus dulcis TaxID=3755 RepID=A0AAD4VJ02_PRUDU|nr:hypothetical protein L3X38_034181 [Prunus dulcis]
MVPLNASKLAWLPRATHKCTGWTIMKLLTIAKLTTVRVLLSMAISKGWPIQQSDVNNAFIHSDLSEHMQLPLGYSDKGEHLV